MGFFNSIANWFGSLFKKPQQQPQNQGFNFGNAVNSAVRQVPNVIKFARPFIQPAITPIDTAIHMLKFARPNQQQLDQLRQLPQNIQTGFNQNVAKPTIKFAQSIPGEFNQHISKPVGGFVHQLGENYKHNTADYNQYMDTHPGIAGMGDTDRGIVSRNPEDQKTYAKTMSLLGDFTWRPIARVLTALALQDRQNKTGKEQSFDVTKIKNPFLRGAAEIAYGSGDTSFLQNNKVGAITGTNEGAYQQQAKDFTKIFGANEQTAKDISLPLGMVFAGLDIIPGAGKTDDAAKALSKVSKVSEVASYLKTILKFGDDNIIKKIAPKIAKSTDAKEIKTLLNGAIKEQKVISSSVKVLPDATKGIKATTQQLFQRLSQPLQETLSNLPSGNIIPDNALNVNKYIKQNVKLQKTARTVENPGLKGFVSNLFHDAKKNLVEQYAPIEDAVRIAAKKGKYEILPSHDIHYQIDRVLRHNSLAGQFLEDNGLTKIIQKSPNVNALDQYLIAKRAVELAGQGVETGRDITKDKSLIKQLAPTYEAHAQAVYQYSHKLLDYVTDSGLISKDLRTKLLTENPNYVPVNRILDAVEKGTNYVGSGIASLSKQSVVQKIKGSTKVIESPLNSLVDKTETAFKQGEINKAGSMLASYRDLPGMKGLFRELKPGETVGAKYTISYLENGVKRTFETTPDIAAAAKNLDSQQLGLVGKILAAPVRVAKLGITGLRLAFTGANLVRDQVSAIINSNRALKTSAANPVNFVASLFSALGHGNLYKEVVRNAGMGTSFDIFRNPAVANLKKIRSERNIATRTMYTVTHPGQLVRAAEDIIGRSEEWTRIQQYRGIRNTMLKEGRTAQDAAILAAEAARTNTVNFARHGAWGKVLNSVMLYLNPAIQGSRTLVRNLKERPLQTGTKIVLTTFTPVAYATLWNISDPKRKAAYNDIPEWEKENAIIIVPPNPTQDAQGRWNVIKVPLSQEIARLSSVVRRPIEAAHGLDPVKFGEMANAMLSTVSPVDTSSPSKVASSLIPQALKPTIEDLTNTNLFTGNKVVPEYLKALPPEMQVNKGTTSTAKGIGKLLNISPLRVENFVRSTFGGLGSEALHYGDVAMNKAGLIPADQVKGTGSGEATLNRFFKASGGEDANKVYGAINRMKSDKQTRNTVIKNQLLQGDTSGLQGLTNQEKSSLIKSVKEEQAKAGLTDVQKAIFGTSKTQKLALIQSDPTLANDVKLVYQLENALKSNSNTTSEFALSAIADQLNNPNLTPEQKAQLQQAFDMQVVGKTAYKKLKGVGGKGKKGKKVKLAKLKVRSIKFASPKIKVPKVTNQTLNKKIKGV